MSDTSFLEKQPVTSITGNEIPAHISKIQLFLGRMLLEVAKKSVHEHKKELYGLAKDSKFQIADGKIDPNTGNLVITDIEDSGNVPYKEGKILKMASDAFGERFKKNYGTDFTSPNIGDIVLFVNNQTFKVDTGGKYHILGDEQIIGFYTP